MIRKKRSSKSIDLRNNATLDIHSHHQQSLSVSTLNPSIKADLKSSNRALSSLKLPKLAKSPQRKFHPSKIVTTSFPTLPLKSYISASISKLPDHTPNIPKYHAFVDSPLSSSPDSERVEPNHVKIITEYIYKHFIEAVILNQCRPIAKECINELMSASLLLFSSSILDVFIREVLHEFISEITELAINEVLDSDYINYQEELINTEISHQVNRVVRKTSRDSIAKIIFSEILETLNVAGIVKLCISEERKFNKLIYQSMVDIVIDQIVQEDWFEILAEDELCTAKLTHNMKIMPIKLQKEIFRKGNMRVLERAIEEIYFDILKDYVSGIWLSNIVNYYAFPVGSFEINIIMPLTDRKTPERKRSSL